MKFGTSALPALLLAVTTCVAQAADLTLRFGTPFVTNSNLHKAMEKFAEVVDKEMQTARSATSSNSSPACSSAPSTWLISALATPANSRIAVH
jgi:hypothetical protein